MDCRVWSNCPHAAGASLRQLWCAVLTHAMLPISAATWTCAVRPVHDTTRSVPLASPFVFQGWLDRIQDLHQLLLCHNCLDALACADVGLLNNNSSSTKQAQRSRSRNLLSNTA